MPMYTRILDTITMACGMAAATIVAFKPEFIHIWFAFPLYVVSAMCGIYANTMRKAWPLVILFGYYLFIDSYGVYNWWPGIETIVNNIIDLWSTV